MKRPLRDQGQLITAPLMDYAIPRACVIAGALEPERHAETPHGREPHWA